MNLLHLKYVVEVEKAGSINKAAEKLYMGQPNLSRAIKELEKNLGVTLFKRTSKGIAATEEGAEFIAYARSILRQVDEMEMMYQDRKLHKVQLSISVPRAEYIMQAFIALAQKLEDCQQSEFRYQETNAEETISVVESAEYHLGIVRYPLFLENQYVSKLQNKRLVYKPIRRSARCLIMSKKHPLAHRNQIVLSDLKKYVEIIDKDSDGFNQNKDQTAESAQGQRRIFLLERNHPFQLLGEVTNAYLWGPEVSDKLLAQYDLIQKRTEDVQQSYQDVFVYRENYQLSEIDWMFLNQLVQVEGV